MPVLKREDRERLLRQGAARGADSYVCWGCGRLIPEGEEEIKRTVGLGSRGYVPGAENLGIYHLQCKARTRRAR